MKHSPVTKHRPVLAGIQACSRRGWKSAYLPNAEHLSPELKARNVTHLITTDGGVQMHLDGIAYRGLGRALMLQQKGAKRAAQSFPEALGIIQAINALPDCVVERVASDNVPSNCTDFYIWCETRAYVFLNLVIAKTATADAGAWSMTQSHPSGPYRLRCSRLLLGQAVDPKWFTAFVEIMNQVLNDTDVVYKTCESYRGFRLKLR